MNVCHSIAHGLLFFGAASIAATTVAGNEPKAQPAAVSHTSAAHHNGDTGKTSTDRTQSGATAPNVRSGATAASPAQGDNAEEGSNSVFSFLSLFDSPMEEPPAVAQPADAHSTTAQAPATQTRKQPLPARPPADNTPDNLPQPYGSATERSAESLLWQTEISPWGPFYSTLSPQDNALGMGREFAAGPFWEQRTSSTRHDTFLRPLWTEYDHFAEGRNDLHILTPAFTKRETLLSYEWNVFLFINYTRLGAVDDKNVKTFVIFPLFFWNDNGFQPQKSFWGLFPVYGEINHFFSFQHWDWVLFPIYTRMQDWYGVNRYGVPYPFIQVFNNEAGTANGFYLWPLYGNARYEGQYERMFWMWPLVYRQIDQFHRPVPRIRQGFLPFYAFEHSEHVEDVSVLMFWGWRHDSKTQYDEQRYLWPLWIQGRSPERYVNRWAPFYTHSKTPRIEKWWYMWPAVQHRKVPERGVLMERSQFFYFLYWHETQTSIENPHLPSAEMRFVWPFYASYDNGAGVTQRQVLSIFEVFFPHNRAMRDTYSPIFSLYRQEADANTGLKRWSLLWNLVGSLETERNGVAKDSFHIWPLYQSDSEKTQAEESDSWSVLFGLFGWKSTTTQQQAGVATANANGDAVAATQPDAAPQNADAQEPATQESPATVAETNAAPATQAAEVDTSTADAALAADTAEADAPRTRNTLTLFWFDIEL